MSTLLNIGINNYGLQKMKEESGTGTMQSKEVTITTNGTTNVSADTGYAGLSNVAINTNVTPTLQNKQVNITSNGTTTIQKDTGYDGLNIVEVNTNVRAILGAGTSFRQHNSSVTDFDWLAMADMRNITDAKNMFQSCSSVTSIPSLYNMGNNTSTQNMFQSCSSLITIGSFDCSKVTTMRSMFQNCANLESVPIYDTSSVSDLFGFIGMFANCNSLTNESLNNILKMCINATLYTGTKTLQNLSISSEQAIICQELSNWNDFISAGWSSGY